MWLDAPRPRWAAPLFAAGLGVVGLLAGALGGQIESGLIIAIVMLLAALATFFAGRSELIRGLRGDGRDERFAQIDLRATAYAGLALTVAIIGAFWFELANGRNGTPYTWLAVVGGGTYLLSIAVLRVRS